jgi:hypothetical protein
LSSDWSTEAFWPLSLSSPTFSSLFDVEVDDDVDDVERFDENEEFELADEVVDELEFWSLL